ncbi:MAG: hypothetical protein QMD22_06825 [archaeon]|nr:hypothetical protein [archaeon]
MREYNLNLYIRYTAWNTTTLKPEAALKEAGRWVVKSVKQSFKARIKENLR